MRRSFYFHDYLHRLLIVAASRSAAFAAAGQLVDSCESNEDIDDCLDFHPGTEEHIHHVPVSTAEEHTETNKAPVDCSYEHEHKRDHAESIFLTHNRGRERIRTSLL